MQQKPRWPGSTSACLRAYHFRAGLDAGLDCDLRLRVCVRGKESAVSSSSGTNPAVGAV